MKPALDGAGLFLQAFGYFRDGELFEIAQQYHFEVMRRQRFQRVDQIQSQGMVAAAGKALLGGLISEGSSKQWNHYPENDSMDLDGGFQWFYHAHSPQDRPNTTEHGHIHLFARKKRWGRRMASRAEQEFATLTGRPGDAVSTRHLIAIGLNAKGVPISLFTVNSWVTGDLMLSRRLTMELLQGMRLNTGPRCH